MNLRKEFLKEFPEHINDADFYVIWLEKRLEMYINLFNLITK